MVERIQEIIDKEKTTASAFADEIGVSRGAMNHILNGRNKPSLDVLLKIVNRYKGINPEWLMMGTPPMYKNEKVAIQTHLFDENPINPDQSTEGNKYSKEMENKQVEPDIKQTNTQSFITELSMSDNIDKIVIFFKNKTFITLKPED